MIGTLHDVFEISGRGCVVLIEDHAGTCRAGDAIVIGEAEWTIAGLEMINYQPEALKRMGEGWRPPLGLLLRNASKDDLIGLVGQRCSTLGKATDR